MIRSIVAVVSMFLASAAIAQDAAAPVDPAVWHAERVRELSDAYRQAYEAKDYKQAARVGYELVKHDQLNGRSAYNLACAFALDGRLDEAAKWLRNAAAHGYADPVQLRNDSDLDAIREHKLYKAADAQIRDNRTHQLNEFKRWWDKRPLHVDIPKDAGKNPPLVIALHGFGMDGATIAGLWKETAFARGAVLVAPESGHRIDGRDGYQWSSEDEAEWVILRTIKRMEDSYGIDPARIVVTGYSQGAFVGMRFGMKYPDKVAGVIPVAGIYDPQLMPFNEYKDGPLPRFYLMIGSEDRNVQTMHDAKAVFEDRDASVELVVYEGLGHAFPEDTDAELEKAISFVLPAEKARE